jgi:uncharacterized protein (TIGR02147 family)
MLSDVLLKEFQRRSAVNPSFTLRAFAQKLGVNSGSLSSILRGRRKVSLDMTVRLLKACDVDAQTRLNVIAAVTGAAAVGPAYHPMDLAVTELLSEWHHFAILSLFETKNAKPDVKWISSKLKISTAQVFESLRLLKKLDLLREKNGKLAPTHTNLAATDGVPSSAVRRAHRQTIEKALVSLETHTVNERDFSGVTMAIDPARLPEAKKIDSRISPSTVAIFRARRTYRRL